MSARIVLSASPKAIFRERPADIAAQTENKIVARRLITETMALVRTILAFVSISCV